MIRFQQFQIEPGFGISRFRIQYQKRQDSVSEYDSVSARLRFRIRTRFGIRGIKIPYQHTCRWWKGGGVEVGWIEHKKS